MEALFIVEDGVLGPAMKPSELCQLAWFSRKLDAASVTDDNNLVLQFKVGQTPVA